MRVADITMIGELMAFHPEEPRAAMILSHRVQSSRTVILVEDNFNAYLYYDAVFEGKWAGHIESKPGIRGKELWAFAYDTAKWMVENRGMEHLLCFASRQQKELHRFIRLFGMQKVGNIGNEVLYTVDRETILKFGGIGNGS